MGILRRRPLFACCSAFLFAAAAGFFLPVWGKLILGAALALTAAILAFVRIRKGHGYKYITAIVACVLAILALVQSHLWFCEGFSKNSTELEGQTVTVSGVVTDRRSAGGYLTSYALDVEALNGKRADGKAFLSCHYVSDLQPGMAITATAQVISLSEAAGDGYDAMALMGDGYRMGLLSESEADVVITKESVRSLSVMTGAIRRTLSARLELLTEGGNGLPAALLLGERAYLADDVRRDFARAGVSHLLAISGLHMTLLFGMLAGLLSWMGLPKRLRAWILGLAVFAYLLLLGFPPSATRAAIMLGMTYLSLLLSSRSDPLTSLGLAGALILLLSPCSVVDGGFWMSYLATLGILSVLPLLDDGKPTSDAPNGLWRRLLLKGKKLAVGLAVGVIATAFTMPAVALVIGETSLLSPVTTLLLTPLCDGILILSIGALLLMALPVGGVVGSLAALFCKLSALIAAGLGYPSEVVVSLRYPFVMAAVAVCLAALMILLAVNLRRKWRWLVLTPVAAAWMVVGIFPTVAFGMDLGRMDVTYLQPSSQSEALVMVSGRESVICDLSNGSLSAMSAAVREAEAMYATEVAVLMLTHYHSRTPGALAALLNRETVRALWCPEPQTQKDYYLLLSCMERAEAAGVAVYLYDTEEALGIFDEVEVTLYTAAIPRSVQPVILLSCAIDHGEGKHRILYCGGATFESDLRDTAKSLTEQAHTVLFGSHGPVIHEPFGDELTYSQAKQVILSAHGDVGAWMRTDTLPATVPLWIGQKRRLTEGM